MPLYPEEIVVYILLFIFGAYLGRKLSWIAVVFCSSLSFVSGFIWADSFSGIGPDAAVTAMLIYFGVSLFLVSMWGTRVIVAIVKEGSRVTRK